jgi:hypothetical protein
VNIFKDAPHQSLRNGVRAAREVVRRNGGCVIDAFDLELSSVLFAEFVAERLADDGALWSPLALSLFDMFGNLFGDLTMLPASVEPRAQTKTTLPQEELRENSFSESLVRSSWRGATSRGRAVAMEASARAW